MAARVLPAVRENPIVNWLSMGRLPRSASNDGRGPLGADTELAGTLEAAGLCLWRLDLLERQLHVSATFRAQFGFDDSAPLTLDEFCGRIDPGDRDRAHAALENARSGLRDLDVRCRIATPDRGARWIHVHGRRVPRDDQPDACLVGIALDVTDDQHVERSHAAGIERWVQASGALGIGTWEWRADEHRFLWSREEERLHGLPPGSFDGRPESRLALVHPEDRELQQEHLLRPLLPGQELRSEFRVVRPDGTLCWIGSRARAICDGQGRPCGRIGIDEDITSRKLLEAEREEAVSRERGLRAAAELANRSKDDFLGLVSHELRSPLNAILGWNRVLGLKRADDPLVTETLARIERSAKIQLKLIEDLLDAARIAAGELELDCQRISPVAPVIAALDAIRPTAESKGVAMVADIDPAAGLIMADAERLQQVVANLLSNAIKFTPRGGRAALHLRRASGAVEIAIEDSGQGIAASRLPGIFDRAAAPNGSSTRRQSGLGLGLVVVRALVAMHGGRISAASDGEGRGATFTVNLPLAALDRSFASVTADAGPSPWALEGLAILIVDDEPEAREFLKAALESYGAQVSDTESVASAIPLLTASPEHRTYDVLVSDIAMPGEDGYSLVARLRQWESLHGGHLPALALSGHATREDRRRATEAGFDRHMSKPVEIPELVEAIVGLPRMTRVVH